MSLVYGLVSFQKVKPGFDIPPWDHDGYRVVRLSTPDAVVVTLPVQT